MRPNTYNPDCDFDPDQRDLDASIKERNKTESDATERARAFRESYDRTLENAKVWMGSHPWAFDVFEQKDGTTETEGEHYTRIMAAFLESETPRIKADAVREFIAEVEKEIVEPSGDDLFDGHQLLTTGSVLEVMQTVQARQIAKEMTEEAK